MVIDNSANLTTTSTIQGKLPTFETDISSLVLNPGLTQQVTQQFEKVHVTYPMLYDILYGFWKVTQFPGYTTILNGTSAFSSPLCIRRKISYTNVFAVPQVVVQRNPIAISSVDAFFFYV